VEILNLPFNLFNSAHKGFFYYIKRQLRWRISTSRCRRSAPNCLAAMPKAPCGAWHRRRRRAVRSLVNWIRGHTCAAGFAERFSSAF
jgi:hypothetical protein